MIRPRVIPIKSRTKALPFPIKGWNTRDPVENMKPGYAITMDNILPIPGGGRFRDGSAKHATGLGAPVQSLMTYSPPSGVYQQFAAAGPNIYDVTAGGAVGAAVVGSLSSALFQHTMHVNAAVSVLFVVNGADNPQYFNGSSWTTPTITGSGLTNANIVNCAVHQNRIWLVEKDSLNVWYLAVSAVSGTATKFPLAGYCRKGGSILAVGTLSRDGGRGPDDYWIAVTTEGEAIAFAGTDPSSSSTWVLIGVYSIPKPIGRRCLMKTGSDLTILTERGLVPASQVIAIAESGQSNTAITNAIAPTFTTAAQGGATFTSWQLFEYPRQGLFCANIPQSAATSHQYVMNAELDDGPWCRFRNLNALVWNLVDQDLFFGDALGNVWQYGVSETDDGVGIEAYLQTAFSDLGFSGEKIFQMIRPSLQAPYGLTLDFTLKTDYDRSAPVLNVVDFLKTGSPWDTSPWDTSPWDIPAVSQSQWQPAEGVGHTVSVAFGVRSKKRMGFSAFDLMFQPGGPM